MLGLLGTRITRRRHRLTGLQGMHALLEQLHHGQPIAVLLLVVQESPESLGGQRSDAVCQGALGQVVVVGDRELSAVRHSGCVPQPTLQQTGCHASVGDRATAIAFAVELSKQPHPAQATDVSSNLTDDDPADLTGKPSRGRASGTTGSAAVAFPEEGVGLASGGSGPLRVPGLGSGCRVRWCPCLLAAG